LSDAGYLTARRFMNVRVLLGMTAVLAAVDEGLLHAAPLDARFATRAELLKAAERPEWREQLTPKSIALALARGEECFALFDGDLLASLGWYARVPTPIDDEMLLHFDPAWVYMHRGYTIPAYRGRRLHGMGMSLALRHYTREGANGLVSFVEFNNLQSLKSVSRMGYRIFGSIYLATVGGRPRSWSSPGCREYQFYLLPARRSAAS
jgi:hypothetical protein